MSCSELSLTVTVDIHKKKQAYDCNTSSAFRLFKNHQWRNNQNSWQAKSVKNFRSVFLNSKNKKQQETKQKTTKNKAKNKSER